MSQREDPAVSAGTDSESRQLRALWGGIVLKLMWLWRVLSCRVFVLKAARDGQLKHPRSLSQIQQLVTLK
eukprot:492137-Pelagomonas_calceolata.AAC.5